MASARSLAVRPGAEAFIRSMEAALRPLTNMGGEIGTPGTTAHFKRTKPTRYAGGPFKKPTRAMPNPPRELAEGYRHQRGEFRLSGTFDRIYTDLEDGLEQAVIGVFDEANAFMQDISPHDTGQYKAHIIVQISVYERAATTLRRNRFFRIWCRMMTEEENPYDPDRDPREYAIFVEYGGDHTPAYYVFRRTMDFTIKLAIDRFQQATGGRAFRGITPRPA